MNQKLRYAIAFEAARLMYERAESEYYTAKRKAAKRVCPDRCKPEDLPSNAEVRDLIQTFARMHEGDRRTDHLKQMRLQALRLMRVLRAYRPRLIGSVLTGHVRKGSDIDLHVFCDGVGPITDLLDAEGLPFEVERKQVRKNGEETTYTHVHVTDEFRYELTVYPEDKAHYVFKSSITGKAIERASIRELEEFLLAEYPTIDLEEAIEESELRTDPYLLYKLLLMPLETVRQDPRWHPEGDALFHALQVFEVARDERPYDEEFLLAALLHDVGKAIDPADHVGAGLLALEGLITERTAFLIRHHMDAHAYRDGTLPHKLRGPLKQSEYFEDLMQLEECDKAGRVPGARVGTVDEALAFIRELAQENEG